MRMPFAAVAACCAFACDALAADMDAVVVDAKSSVATPLLIVAPEYPSNATPGRKVEVRVHGKVTADGVFAAPQFSSGGEGESAYVDEVRKVLEFWRFVPAVDRERCKPREDEATVYVWFETKDGNPAVFVSMGREESVESPAPAAAAAEGAKAQRSLTRKRDPQVDYPRRAALAGIEGTSLVLLKVRNTGKVEDVAVRAYSPVAMFREAAIEGMRNVEFEPFDAAAWGREAICTEIEVNFCMGRRAKFPEPRCAPEGSPDRFRSRRAVDWKAFE